MVLQGGAQMKKCELFMPSLFFGLLQYYLQLCWKSLAIVVKVASPGLCENKDWDEVTLKYYKIEYGLLFFFLLYCPRTHSNLWWEVGLGIWWSKSISNSACYVTLQKCCSHPSFSYLFFSNHTHETHEAGMPKYRHLWDRVCICICRLVIFCLLKLNVIVLRFVSVNPTFVREGRFAYLSDPLVSHVLKRVM